MDTNNNDTVKETAVNIMEICLLCGGRKQEKRSVCSNCYRNYIDAAKGCFLNTGGDLPFLKWQLQQAEKAFPKIERVYNETKAAVDALRKQSSQVKGDLGKTELQTHLSQNEFDELVATRRKKIWEENNGNKLFGDMKRLEICVMLTPDLIKYLKDKLQSDANNEMAATAA